MVGGKWNEIREWNTSKGCSKKPQIKIKIPTTQPKSGVSNLRTQTRSTFPFDMPIPVYCPCIDDLFTAQ